MITQKEVTEKGLRYQELTETFDNLTESAKGRKLLGKDLVTYNEIQSAMLEAETDYANANNELRAGIKHEMVDRPGAPIRGINANNPLRTPGVEVRNNYGYDQYGFSEYQRNRYGSLVNFNDNEEGIRTAELIGAFALATNPGIEQGSNLNKLARKILREKHQIEDPFTFRMQEYDKMQRRDLSEAVSGSGGILVPTVLESAIIILRETYGVFERNAQTVPMIANQIKWPRRHQGIDAFWETEQAPLNFDQKMKFSQVELNALLLTSIIAFSNQLDQDSVIPLGDYIAGEMAYKFAYKIDSAAFLGTADGANGNVLGLRAQFLANRPHTNAANPGLFLGTTSGEAAEWGLITIDDISKFMGAMSVFSPDTSNCRFYGTWAAYNAILNRLQSKAGGNTNITIRDGVGSSSTYEQGFLGHKVEITQIMPRNMTGGSSDIVLYFGDMSLAAMMGTRRAMETTTSKEAGQAYINNQTYMRSLYRGIPNIHDSGLTTVDPAGNAIAGPMVAFYTHA